MTDAPAIQPGSKLGPYCVVRRLGEGGMGSVWEATHERLGKRVAIKTLHPSVLSNRDVVARFMREAQAASRIRHRHVVDVSDVGSEGGVPYLVMELLVGEAMSSLLERTPAPPLETVVDIALPVIDAVQAAHDAGIVHRDLKPDNIFLARGTGTEHHPVVLDFGISKVDDGNPALTKTHATMGTPYYMSPEQARGAKGVDARSDQFSLGLVLYEALVGRRAISGESLLEIVHNITSGNFAPLRAARTDLPADLVKVVERMMSLDREQRFASMRDAGRALLPYASPTVRAVWERELGAHAEGTVPSPDSVVPASPTPSAGGPSTTLGGAARELTIPGLTRGPSRAVWVAATAGLVMIGGMGALFVSGETETEPTAVASSLELPATAAAVPLAARLTSEPADAEIVLDGRVVGRGTYDEPVPRDGRAHVVVVRAEGFASHEIEFTDDAPVGHIVLQPLPAGAQEVATSRGVPSADDAPIVAAPGVVAAPVVAPPSAPSTSEPRARRRSRGSEPTDSRVIEGANGAPIIR